MKLCKAMSVAALMCVATVANAALVKVEDFKKLDGPLNTENRYFTNYGKPFTFQEAGTYVFDIVMTANNQNQQGPMDYSFQYGSAWGYTQKSNQQFSVREVQVQNQKVKEYFATYQFAAKKGDTFAFQANFNPTLGATGKIDFNLSKSVAPVPEPETYALMGVGLVGLLAARRRKAKQTV